MRPIPRLVKWLFSLAISFLLLMSILRFGTYLAFKTDQSFVSILPAIWLGIRYDARIVCIMILVILLLGSMPFLDPFRTKAGRKVWRYYTGIFVVVVVLFYVFDYMHFSYLSQRLNASTLSFLEDARISAHMVWETYPVLKIFLGIAISSIVLLFIVNRLFKRALRLPAITQRSKRIAWFFIVFLICAVAIFGRLGQYPLRWSDAFNLGSDFKANLAINPFQSFFSSLSFRNTSYDKAKVRKSYSLMAEYLGVDKPDSLTFNFERTIRKREKGIAAQPNIVLVICESFSGYKSSMWGNPLNTTPFFNGLAKQGVFFDNCFTPHFGTARGVWATITGIPDVESVKTASRNPAMVDQHTIINNFEGYEKLYFLGGSTSWANIRGLLTNNIKGLHLFEEDSYEVPRVDVWGISDKNLFLQANKILSHQHKPFFAIIQTADNHRPYTISAEDTTEFKKVEFPIDTLKKYGFQSNEELNAFRYTDFGYRHFMQAAAKSAYYENTIFVFVGDHGIFGDAGDMFPRAWSDNGLTAYHVPLLFFSQKYLQARRIHEVASQVDILPTIAGLANITYTNTTLGRDLLNKTGNGGNEDNIAFIIDHNNKDIGIMKGDYFYSRQSSGQKEDLVWANFIQPERGSKNDTLMNTYRNYTNAFFETARYMLLNNKKAVSR